MFLEYPTYSRYRSLTLVQPRQKGEDVYALQIALNYRLSGSLAYDGVLGINTAEAIVDFQEAAKIQADGVAGGETQQRLARFIANIERARPTIQIPELLIRGQLAHESGFRLGNYSPIRSDGSYDAGVAQRNTNYVPAKDGFNPVASIQTLAINTRKHYDLFEGVEHKRRWSLAAGSWNAPAFACWIAKEEGATKVQRNQTLEPGPTSRQIFEGYVASVSAFYL